MLFTLIVLAVIIIVALFVKSYIGNGSGPVDISSLLTQGYGVSDSDNAPVSNGVIGDSGSRMIDESMAASEIDIAQQMAAPVPSCALNTDEKYPLQSVMYEYGGIPDGSSTVGQYNADIPCKPFSVRPDIAYFPATEHMGNKASEKTGIMGFGGQFQPVDMCKKLHCTGCGKCSYEANAPVKDTDDIRRNYPELIDRLRAARTDEYPFFKL